MLLVLQQGLRSVMFIQVKTPLHHHPLRMYVIRLQLRADTLTHGSRLRLSLVDNRLIRI